MVIHINQTKSGIKKEFITSGIKETYTGKAPTIADRGNIELYGPDHASWLLQYIVPPLYMRIPTIRSFFRKSQIKQYYILQNNQIQGRISQYRYDKIKTRYDVSFGESTCRIYPLLNGKHEFLLVFQGDTQIGHITRDTTTRDLKDHYTVYLLGDFKVYAVPIILFVLYYDHNEHGDRGEFRKNSVQKSYGYTYGDANILYDSNWLSTYFPKEEVEIVEIDKEKSRITGRRLAIAQTILEIVAMVIFLTFIVAMLFGDPEGLILCILLMVGVPAFQQWRRKRRKNC